MGTTLALVLGLVGIAGLCIFLAVRGAKKEGASKVVVEILDEGREIEIEAEKRLHAPRRHGFDLFARLRRKNRGD